MIDTFLQQAAENRPVYICDVRNGFQARGTRPLHLYVTLYDRSIRVFPLSLPETTGEEQARFVASYVHASLYNILSTLGAVRVDVYLDKADSSLWSLACNLPQVFQVDEAKERRTGYSKCLNVNERVLNALFRGEVRFSLQLHDLSQAPVLPERPSAPAAAPVFHRLPALTRGKMLLGMDVGGTDVKLSVSVDGALVLCKEFDWFPSAYTRAEELTAPLLLLARLLRAAGSLCRAGRAEQADRRALDRSATLEEMRRGAEAMERDAGTDLCLFDGIGLSFPDVVIQNRVVGGETHKTQGLRNNSQLNYEAQFAQITALNEALAAYVVPGGPVRVINDGPMAAFAASVEQGAGGADLSRGFFAHTLGTDLGTGWVRPDGSIPDIPLELYNMIIDLGSWGQRKFEPEDARSIRNFNTQLPGSLQRYASQSGAFRLAADRLPRQAPEVFQAALDRGLFRWEGARLAVPAEPEDMRKPCLEFLMEQAAQPGEGICQEIFREIGEYLSVIWRETNFILRPEAQTRSLFGRLVMHPACFQLICQGAARREPELRLLAADGNLANTALMRQLDQRPGCTVAQFAQAVGALYYSVSK